MNVKDAENRIKELVKIINKWNEEYFDNDNPSVSDRVYDSHLKELTELESKFPEFILDNSPTKKIGALVKNKFKKIKHEKQMFSLNKAYSFSDIQKFFNDILEMTNDKNIKFLIQPKIDGLSISLKYKNGELIQAITRGDGSVGEDVTQNIKNIIKDIPVHINYKGEMEVRGEIYISKSNFKKVIENEKIDYANSRNLASGTLRQLNNKVVEKRNLSSFIYELVDPEKHKIYTQEEVIPFLQSNNFSALPNYLITNVSNQNEIFDFIKDFENNIRDNLEYDIDGMVLKLNENKYYEEIGYTSKFPKFMIAYKFDEELTQTILEDIFITIGRTGIVTYNAKLTKVLLKGTMVSAATLHNYNYIEELGININDEVTIKKAGEIIPKVVSLSKKLSNGIFNKILICPYCQSNLIDTKTMNNQVCANSNCPEINIKKIIHFASKGAMDIEGLGEGVVRKFYELGFLKKIEDIFLLDKFEDQIIEEKGFGKKFWSNLKDGINKSYNVSLEKLIFALGIPQLGSRNAKNLAKKIQKFDKLFSINNEGLASINDIGEITINEFKEYIKKENNIDLFNFLISININPEYEKNSEKSIPFFDGKTFVISGTFDIPRNQLTKIIEENGGTVSSSVSKKIYALLLGDNGGSKKEKAKNLKVKIITKDELQLILNNF
ncbi:MAG: NAD-dependent DNA ligase LigA [Mycoplasma sp.]|nr:NAD-dependent DNA ligase LigA [Mycoplasma sp.]